MTHSPVKRKFAATNHSKQGSSTETYLRRFCISVKSLQTTGVPPLYLHNFAIGLNHNSYLDKANHLLRDCFERFFQLALAQVRSKCVQDILKYPFRE